MHDHCRCILSSPPDNGGTDRGRHKDSPELGVVVPADGEGADRRLYCSRDHHIRHLHLYGTANGQRKLQPSYEAMYPLAHRGPSGLHFTRHAVHRTCVNRNLPPESHPYIVCLRHQIKAGIPRP